MRIIALVSAYFIKRVSTAGGVRRAMLFCAVPEFHASSMQFVDTATCTDFVAVAK